jgi:hypothetical protein
MFVENAFEEDDADDQLPAEIKCLVFAAADDIAFRPYRDRDGSRGDGLGERLGDSIIKRLTDLGKMVIPVVREIALDAKNGVKVVGGRLASRDEVGELIVSLVQYGL